MRKIHIRYRHDKKKKKQFLGDNVFCRLSVIYNAQPRGNNSRLERVDYSQNVKYTYFNIRFCVSEEKSMLWT